MSYIHTGKKPVTLKADPVDPDATDWVFFVYGDWLRESEVITSHAVAEIVGGTVETDSAYFGAMTDESGTAYTGVYGVQFSVEAGASSVSITHRVSTETTDTPSVGRLNMDRTAIIPVKTL